jgi:hypothetical protein
LPFVRKQPRTQSGTGIDQALGTAAHATERELRDAYAAAVSHGARNTRCAADEERATADDRTLVPAELTDGLAHLLAVYLIATTLACSGIS